MILENGDYAQGVIVPSSALQVPVRPSSKHTWNGSTWEFIGYSSAESMTQLRIERNQLLAESDWRMLSDYPGTNQAEWQTYRQALRDITTQQTASLDENGNLTGITWPTPPTD